METLLAGNILIPGTTVIKEIPMYADYAMNLKLRNIGSASSAVILQQSIEGSYWATLIANQKRIKERIMYGAVQNVVGSLQQIPIVPKSLYLTDDVTPTQYGYDTGDGVVVGSPAMGAASKINYITGAFDITWNGAPGGSDEAIASYLAGDGSVTIPIDGMKDFDINFVAIGVWTVVVVGTNATYTLGETVTAADGGAGILIAKPTTLTMTIIQITTGPFTGVLTGGTSGAATSTVSSRTCVDTLPSYARVYTTGSFLGELYLAGDGVAGLYGQS